MTTTNAAPEPTMPATPPPAAAPPAAAPPAAGAMTTVTPPAAGASPPEPKNAQALRSLEADERAAELPTAPSNTMNAFASGYAFETAQRMANALASSSVVPKAYIGNPANCLIAMEVASRMRMSVIAVMQNLDIVHGTPSWRAKFLIAMANSSRKFSRLRWQWFGTEGKDDWGARAYATDLVDGEKLVGPLVTIAIAKAEGWYSRTGSKWPTIPELMIMYRSAGWWNRVYDPEDSMGFGTVEEAEDVHGVEFDRKVGEPGMRDVPGMENANQGRRMSLRPTPAAPTAPSVPAAMSNVVDAEFVDPKPEQAREAVKPSAPTGGQLPLGGGHTSTTVASAAEGAALAARMTAEQTTAVPPAREPGSDDDDAGDAPTAEEIETGKPNPHRKAR